jgi:hypothetical protein
MQSNNITTSPVIASFGTEQGGGDVFIDILSSLVLTLLFPSLSILPFPLTQLVVVPPHLAIFQGKWSCVHFCHLLGVLLLLINHYNIYPTVWLEGASPANTCILPSFP